MIDKNRIFDVYLVAFANHRGISAKRNVDGSFRVQASDALFCSIYKHYRVDFQQVLRRARRLQKLP